MDSGRRKARPKLTLSRNRHAAKLNAPSPVSCLPNELLASIFVCLAEDLFPRDEYVFRDAVPRWAKVSHVSARWRRVALNCAALWSYISVTSRRWIKVSLERAGQVPLKISVEAEKDKRKFWLSTLSVFSKRADQIEELRLWMHWWDAEIHQIFAMLCSSARLKILELSMGGIYLMDQISLDGDIPMDLWHFFKPRNLTTLILCVMPDPLQYDMSDLRVALGCMPDLEHLYLDDAIAGTEGFMDFGGLPKIVLPRLTRLMITAPVWTIIAFFSGVNVSAHTKIRLCCQFEDDSLDDYDRLFHTLAQNYSDDHPPSRPAIHSVILKISSHYVAFRMSTLLERNQDPVEFFSLRRTDWGDNTPLEITLDLDSSSSWSTLGDNMCTAIPIANDVHVLHVINPPSDRGFWRKILGRFSGLRHLKLSDGFIPNGLISALRPQRGDGPMKNQEMFVPQLDELELVGIQFPINKNDSYPGSGSGDSKANQAAQVQLLCDALSGRRGKGRLTMTKCGTDGKYGMGERWGDGPFHAADECHTYDESEEEDEDQETWNWDEDDDEDDEDEDEDDESGFA